jgi:hypothetical protein
MMISWPVMYCEAGEARNSARRAHDLLFERPAVDDDERDAGAVRRQRLAVRESEPAGAAGDDNAKGGDVKQRVTTHDGGSFGCRWPREPTAPRTQPLGARTGTAE